MIPTIGRVVLYFPLPDEVDHEHSQAFPALVCHVHNEEGTSIAIGGFTDTGEPFSRKKLIFVDGVECTAGQACWMPYQKAKEAEDAGKVPVAKVANAQPANTTLSKG